MLQSLSRWNHEAEMDRVNREEKDLWTFSHFTRKEGSGRKGRFILEEWKRRTCFLILYFNLFWLFSNFSPLCRHIARVCYPGTVRLYRTSYKSRLIAPGCYFKPLKRNWKCKYEDEEIKLKTNKKIAQSALWVNEWGSRGGGPTCSH